MHYLELDTQCTGRLRKVEDAAIEVIEVVPPDPELSRLCYTTIGARQGWFVRARWTVAEWTTHLARPDIYTVVLASHTRLAGYCELQRLPSAGVEILYFGLLRVFMGSGLGAHFLSEVIDRARTEGAARIRVKTCDNDHPHALPNYLARGFVEVKREIHYVPHLT